MSAIFFPPFFYIYNVLSHQRHKYINTVYAYSECNASNTFQNSWDGGNNRLGKLWNAQKHLFVAFHRQTG